MSDVQNAGINPFDIFKTNVNEITSFEETDRRDWSKTFYEQDPEKGPRTALIKLITNIFNPNDPTPLRVTYRLPDPDNPTAQYTFVSPNSVGQKCPVMTKWWEMYEKGKTGDLIMAQKAKQLSRKRYRACYIQIINDLQEKDNNYALRLMKFPVEFDVEGLIQSKINPAEDAIASAKAMGVDLVAENIFDIFKSSLLILTADKGDRGRSYKKSTWAPADKGHGVFIPVEFDSAGNPLKYRALTEADRPVEGVQPSEELTNGLQWLMTEMQKEEINIQSQWMYTEPDAEMLEKVRRSLHYIEFGTILPKSDGTQPVAQPTQPVAQPTQPVAQPTQPVAQPVAQPTQPVAQPTQPVAQPTPTTEANGGDDDLLAQLGIIQ